MKKLMAAVCTSVLLGAVVGALPAAASHSCGPGGHVVDHLTNGDDTKSYGGAANCVDAKDGNDQVSLGNGSPSDIALGGGGSDALNGEGGEDALYGEGGADTLNGGNGPDYLYGGTGADTLLGEDGDDHIADNPGLDTIRGGAGYDVLWECDDEFWQDQTVTGIEFISRSEANCEI